MYIIINTLIKRSPAGDFIRGATVSQIFFQLRLLCGVRFGFGLFDFDGGGFRGTLGVGTLRREGESGLGFIGHLPALRLCSGLDFDSDLDGQSGDGLVVVVLLGFREGGGTDSEGLERGVSVTLSLDVGGTVVTQATSLCFVGIRQLHYVLGANKHFFVLSLGVSIVCFTLHPYMYIIIKNFSN